MRLPTLPTLKAVIISGTYRVTHAKAVITSQKARGLTSHVLHASTPWQKPYNEKAPERASDIMSQIRVAIQMCTVNPLHDHLIIVPEEVPYNNMLCRSQGMLVRGPGSPLNSS